MNEDFSDLKVDYRIWIVGHPYTGRHVDGPVPMRLGVVVKVGRKFLTVREITPDGVPVKGLWADEEFVRETGWNKSRPNYSQDRTLRLYRDINDYVAYQERLSLESAFIEQFRGYSARLNDGVTSEDIRAAAKLLRVDLKEKK
jgi:hypothetical protein